MPPRDSFSVSKMTVAGFVSAVDVTGLNLGAETREIGGCCLHRRSLAIAI
jgi:hypothetical protein